MEEELVIVKEMLELLTVHLVIKLPLVNLI